MFLDVLRWFGDLLAMQKVEGSSPFTRLSRREIAGLINLESGLSQLPIAGLFSSVHQDSIVTRATSFEVAN